jgi:hypothetical protein
MRAQQVIMGRNKYNLKQPDYIEKDDETTDDDCCIAAYDEWRCFCSAEQVG